MNEDSGSYTLTLTTQRLLCTAAKARMLQGCLYYNKFFNTNKTYHKIYYLGDGTHKLVLEDGTVLVIGVSDKARAIHPVTLSISSNENESTFSNALKVIRDNNPGWTPTFSLSDSAEAFPNAVRSVFFEENEKEKLTRGMCYSHVSPVSY